MWSISEPASAPPPAAPRDREPARTAFGKTLKTTLDRPALGTEFLLDLKTGRKRVPPKFVTADDIKRAWNLTSYEEFLKWCREQNIDLYVQRTPPATYSAPGAPKPSRPRLPFALIGVEMIAVRIVPQSFDELTVEGVREILERTPESSNKWTWMGGDPYLLERPDTFAFRSRDGVIGLLRFLEPDGPDDLPTIEYRLEPPGRQPRAPAR
jgi:hypothetical protein